MLDFVIRTNRKCYPQTLLEECKYKIKKNKIKNLIGEKNDFSSSSSDEFNSESDSESNSKSDSESNSDPNVVFERAVLKCIF